MVRKQAQGIDPQTLVRKRKPSNVLFVGSAHSSNVASDVNYRRHEQRPIAIRRSLKEPGSLIRWPTALARYLAVAQQDGDRVERAEKALVAI